jgi:cyanate lyase
MISSLKLTKLVHSQKNDPVHWNNAEKDFLIENPHLTVKEFAIYLSRTQEAVRSMLYKLELPYNSIRQWTTKEISFLKANQHLTHAEIAKELGRTRMSVIEMHKKLNLPNKSKRQRKNKMTKEQFDALLEWVDAKIDAKDRASSDSDSYREWELRKDLEKLLVTEEIEK